jgi:hypothetical protein
MKSARMLPLFFAFLSVILAAQTSSPARTEEEKKTYKDRHL